jgi:hypothetical protein
MAHDREFWSRHVAAWRASGMTQEHYCRRHRIGKGSLGYWSSTLKKKKAVGSDLVEIRRVEVREEKPCPPIELVVGGRYLLRLWAGTDRDHMQQVLSLLESQP